MNTATDICDLTAATPIAATAESAWRDFYELLKPRMNLLILGTTTVGFSIAARTTADWTRLPNTLLGTALCAASAAILNQYLECEYDGLMPRTAHRPLPTGRIAPIHALLLGIITGILGGLYLLLFVNWMTAMLGSVTLLSYVLVYTPLKRITTLNTIVGAIPGAVPPMMGWTAVTGSLAAPAWALFGILFVWQIPHFLAIATLYREDYRLGGFKMLPVNDPTLRATGRQILLYSAALLPVSLLPVMFGVTGEIYTISAVLLGVGFFAACMSCATRRTRAEARKLFFASIIYLPVLLAVLMLDRI
ncbi:MAG TPA: heme o synthase [Tepidisphaeraceae bacterium]|jgi:protoheme IX farnesyltransferase